MHINLSLRLRFKNQDNYRHQVLFFAFLILFSLFFSKTSAAITSAEMEFKTVEVCDSLQNCKLGIISNGTITPKSASAFLKATEGIYRPMTLFINGGGSDLQAGIALGKMIRAKGFDTQTGLISELSEKTGQTTKYIPRDGGECVSACLLAYLGGQSRKSHPYDVLGFTKLPATTDNANEKKLRSMATEYIANVGVNTHTMDYLIYGNSDEIQRIPFTVAQKLNIDTQGPNIESLWHIKAMASGQVIAVISEKDKKSQFSVTLALAKPAANDGGASENLRLIIYIKPIKNGLDSNEITKIVNTKFVVNIRTTNLEINGLPTKKWERYQEGAQSALLVPIQSLEKISEARFFDFSLSSSENSKANNALLFSTDGLKSAIAALKK